VKILFIIIDCEAHVNNFPLGEAYISSFIRERGYDDITIYNQDVFHYPDEHIEKYLNENEYDVVALGLYGYFKRKKAISLSKFINSSKNRSKFKFVLGAHGPTGAPRHYMDTMGADIVVMSEGEETFFELIKTLDKKEPLENINGIAFFNDENNLITNDERPLIRPLNDIPFPAWDLFPIEHYVLSAENAATHTDRCFPLLYSRGCPHLCNYCYKMYGGYRLRTPENVFEEIRILQDRYNITYFTFIDENLMLSEKAAINFAEAMIKSGLKIRWDCMGTVDVATPRVLKVMKEAGCVYINFGIESLDDEVLKLMRKPHTCEEAIRGVEATIEAGIHPGLNIIWGNRGDSAESLRLGKEFLIKYNTPISMRTIKPVTPYPGTELYNIAIEKGLLRDQDDFYAKYINSDLMTVNFTDIPDDEFYRLLFEANRDIFVAYNEMTTKRGVEKFRKCYFEMDKDFRGPRHN
jgi:radical SAM superfamily enzyme YgiQ (UPF0313 family)